MTPLLVTLDLDETLIYATESPLSRDADFLAFQYHVYRRPGLEDFLAFVFDRYRVGFWTSSSRDYASAVVSEIVPEHFEYEFLWSRERCTRRHDFEAHSEYWVKDLRKLKRKGYALERFIFVDNTPSKLERQYGNLVGVRSFEGDLADDELGHLAAYLPTFDDVADVRPIEKRGWRTRVGATKPVEPTGISSFPSDLTTSHTEGDSPGGSLRR